MKIKAVNKKKGTGEEYHEEVEGVPIDFTSRSEPWVTIEVSDDAELRVKPVVSNILRLPDDEDGNPRYNINITMSMRLIKFPKRTFEEVKKEFER